MYNGQALGLNFVNLFLLVNKSNWNQLNVSKVYLKVTANKYQTKMIEHSSKLIDTIFVNIVFERLDSVIFTWDLTICSLSMSGPCY